MSIIPPYTKQEQIQTPPEAPEARQNALGTAGIRELGESFQGLDRGIESIAQGEDHVQRADANAFFSAASSDVRQQDLALYQRAQNSAKPNADGFAQSYGTDLDKLVTDMQAKAPSEFAASAFARRMQPFLAERRDSALKWQMNTNRFYQVDSLGKGIDTGSAALYGTATPDRETAYQSLMADQLHAIDQNTDLTPEERIKLKNKLTTASFDAAIRGDIRDRPSASESWLLGQPTPGGTVELYLSTLRQVESGGNNIGSSTSSAFDPTVPQRAHGPRCLSRTPS